MSFPPIDDEDQFAALRRDVDRARSVLQVVAEDAGLDPDGVTPFSEGSAIVGALGETVLKVFAPFDRAFASTEERVLRGLEGRLSCPTPALLGAGAVDGWPYVVMSYLPGETLAARWPTLAAEDRRSLCEQLGAVASDLHALGTAPFAAIPPPWNAFIAEQRARVVALQSERGLTAPWLGLIEPYLDRLADDPQWSDPTRVLLHTELMREHVLVAPDSGGGWRLTGLIDFEPAMVGAPEYELASVGLFVTGGDRAALRAYLHGAGWSSAEIGPALSRRALGYAVLHRYSNLAGFLARNPVPGAQSLDDLAAAWWAL